MDIGPRLTAIIVPIRAISSTRRVMLIFVMAINMGADDYVTKPDNNVLLAKVQGLLRSYEFETTRVSLSIRCHSQLQVNEIWSLIKSGDLTKNEFLRFCGFSSSMLMASWRVMIFWWSETLEQWLFIDDNTLMVNVARLRVEERLKNLINQKRNRIRSHQWTHR